MRLTTTSSLFLLLPTALLASSTSPTTSADNDTTTSPVPPTSNPEPSIPSATASLPSASSSPTPTHTHESTHYNNLELRQGVGAAAGTVGAIPSATQMSPITSYVLMGPDGVNTPVPHTQTFAAVPDQWPAPMSGAIGLGGIQGQVGVVKSGSKRSLPTGDARRGGEGGGLVARAEMLVKRKKGGGSAGGASVDGGAGMVRVDLMVVFSVVGVGMGFGVVGLL